MESENVDSQFSNFDILESAPQKTSQSDLLRQLEKESWVEKGFYIQWPGTELHKALASWDEGVLFISALENCGKSSIIINMMTGILDLNKDTAVLDISLDDSFRERTRRYIGCLSGVPTNLIARPVQCTEKQKRAREDAFDRMAIWMDSNRLEIRTQAEDDLSRADKIVDKIQVFCNENLGKKIVVVIDSWHDIMLPESRGDEPEKVLLQSLARVLKQNKALCIMTAHRRKSGYSDFSRKSSNDDLKGSAYIKHYAKVMFTLHNEVKARRDNSEIFWEDSNGNKHPILEVSVQKNKTCDYDGWIFCMFQPSTGRCKEVSEQESQGYKAIALESISRSRYSR